MKNNSPGEWETVKNRYGGAERVRRIGNIVEHEMMVSIDGIMMPESQVSDYHRRKKEAKAAAAAQPAPVLKSCPFRLGSNSMATQCSENCSCFTDGCCVFAASNIKPTSDTRGRRCPIIGRECLQACALYDAGCKLVEFVKGIMPGKDN